MPLSKVKIEPQLKEVKVIVNGETQLVRFQKGLTAEITLSNDGEKLILEIFYDED